MCDMKLFPIY